MQERGNHKIECTEVKKGRKKIYSPGNTECNKERQHTFLISGFHRQHELDLRFFLGGGDFTQRRIPKGRGSHRQGTSQYTEQNAVVGNVLDLETMTMMWLTSQILFLLIDKTNNFFTYKSLSFRGDRIQWNVLGQIAASDVKVFLLFTVCWCLCRTKPLWNVRKHSHLTRLYSFTYMMYSLNPSPLLYYFYICAFYSRCCEYMSHDWVQHWEIIDCSCKVVCSTS